MSKRKINDDKVGIYKITNLINEKIYVGQSKKIFRRWKEHIRELNKGKHDNCHLQRAWDKYSQENFEFKIIEECESDILDEREVYWIAFYDSFKNGYNLDSGGKFGRTVSEESIEKMLNSREYVKGGDNPCASLTNEQVLEIKKLLYEGKLSQTEIGDKFQVHYSIISNIKRGATYTNVVTPYDDVIKSKPSLNTTKIKPSVLNKKKYIEEIKRLIVETEISITKIAKMFNVTVKFIRCVRKLKFFPEVGQQYNDRLYIREERVIEMATHIKKTLVESDLTISELARQLKIEREVLSCIAKLKTHKDICPEYNDILKEKYGHLLNTSLSEAQVREIKKILVEQNLKDNEIAKIYGVKACVISSIRLLRNWVSVALEYNDIIKEKYNNKKFKKAA